MQYKLELIRQNRPNNRFGLMLTIETDMKQYISSYQNVFDDNGINEFLAKRHEEFIMIAFECLDICDVEGAQQSFCCLSQREWKYERSVDNGILKIAQFHIRLSE